jgi:hypothetical protein
VNSVFCAVAINGSYPHIVVSNLTTNLCAGEPLAAPARRPGGRQRPPWRACACVLRSGASGCRLPVDLHCQRHHGNACASADQRPTGAPVCGAAQQFVNVTSLFFPPLFTGYDATLRRVRGRAR